MISLYLMWIVIVFILFFFMADLFESIGRFVIYLFKNAYEKMKNKKEDY